MPHIGRRVAGAAQLLPAVHAALQDDAAHADARARYRERIFGDLFDGQASARLAQALAQLAQRLFVHAVPATGAQDAPAP